MPGEGNKKRYPNPPIVEALIELRAQASVELTDLAVIAEREQSRYPQKRQLAQQQVQLRAGQDGAAETSVSKQGYQLWSEDQSQVFQSRLDRFNFSRLHKYENWDSFAAEAKRLWTVHKEVSKCGQITQIGVRFINRIDIPMVGQTVDLDEYLLTRPELSEQLPYIAPSELFMRLQIPQPDIQSQAVLNVANVEPPNQETVSIILDIDLFRHDELPKDESAVWNIFNDTLRPRKNEIFEASITDQARELFK